MENGLGGLLAQPQRFNTVVGIPISLPETQAVPEARLANAKESTRF